MQITDNTLQRSAPIVIIGGGTVGLFIAHELMLSGQNIVLVEAGNESIRSFETDEYENIGHHSNGIAIGRTKGLGGTSNLWGGQMAEFVPEDLNIHNTLNQPNWPIKWDELKKWYAEAYIKLGLISNDDLNEILHTNETGLKLEFFYTKWLKYPNFKKMFLEDLENAPNVRILKNCTVTNLVFKDNKCSHIEYHSNDELKQITSIGNVVLANGTLEIVRLLLISAKSSDCPFADNTNVGKYFQDHLYINIGKIQDPSKAFFEKYSNVFVNNSKLQPKIRLRQNNENEPYIGVSAFFSFSSDVSQHLDNFKQFISAVMGRSKQKLGLLAFLKLGITILKALPQITPLIIRYIKDSKIYIPFNSEVSLSIQAQQISKINSKIELSNTEKDQYGRPKLLLNWNIDGAESLYIERICTMISNYLQNQNLGRLTLNADIVESFNNKNIQWLNSVTDIYHQSGGAIMGNNKENSVVDTNFKVHNTENVYICGAATFPTSGYANTGLTKLALSLKLAQYLQQQKENDSPLLPY